MPPKYENLQALLEQLPQARQYYGSLPDYVKEQISSRAHNINSLESLRDYAENITQGDH